MDAHRALLADATRALASDEAARFVPRVIGAVPRLSAWAANAIEVDESVSPVRGRPARDAPSKERRFAPKPQRSTDPLEGTKVEYNFPVLGWPDPGDPFDSGFQAAGAYHGDDDGITDEDQDGRPDCARAAVACARNDGSYMSRAACLYLENVCGVVPDKPVTQARQKSCRIDMPGEPACAGFPSYFAYKNRTQALDFMKRADKNPNLKPSQIDANCRDKPKACEHSSSCEHTNVLYQGKSRDSIVCCSCCEESSSGPVLSQACKIG